MKKIILFFLFVSFLVVGKSQIAISGLPTLSGNPNGGYVPVSISGITKKFDLGAFLLRTEGVSTSGNYPNPSWIPTFAWSKLTGIPSTIIYQDGNAFSTDLKIGTTNSKDFYLMANGRKWLSILTDGTIGDSAQSKWYIIGTTGDAYFHDIYATRILQPSSDTTTNKWGIFQIGQKVYAGNGTSVKEVGGVVTETDPVFAASPSASITNGLKDNWNYAYGWGNHALAGYLLANGSNVATGHYLPTETNKNDWNEAFDKKITGINLNSSTLQLITQDGVAYTATWPTFNQNTTGNAATVTNGLYTTSNLDPSKISQTASYRLVTDVEKTTWNAKQDALGYTAENAANKGVAGGYVPTNNSNKIDLTYLPAATFVYKGTWNASTNSPALADGTGVSGYTYEVATAGTQNLGSGSLTFSVGDRVMHNGTVWQKSPGANFVNSVNGFNNNVVLTTDNISQGSTNKYYSSSLFNTDLSTKTTDNLGEGTTNLYHTVSRVRTSISNAATGLTYNNSTGIWSLTSGYSIPTTSQIISSFTTTGSSGAATFSGGTLNIPTYTITGLGGVPTTRTVNGYDLSANRTLTTSDIGEGSNLYFTNARVNTQLNTYTGDITFSGGVGTLASTITGNKTWTGSQTINASTPLLNLTNSDATYAQITRSTTSNTLRLSSQAYTQSGTGKAINYYATGQQVSLPLTGIGTGKQPFSISMWLYFGATAGNTKVTIPFVIDWLMYPTIGVMESYSTIFGSSGGNFITGLGDYRNTWKHIVITSDGTNTKVYLNAVLRGTVSSGVSYSFTSSPVVTINDLSGSYSNFIGYLDQTLFYTSAITLSDVTAIYNSGAGNFSSIPQTNLLSRWDCESNYQTGTVIDSKGTNNGTLNNFASSTTAWTTSGIVPSTGSLQLSEMISISDAIAAGEDNLTNVGSSLARVRMNGTKEFYYNGYSSLVSYNNKIYINPTNTSLQPTINNTVDLVGNISIGTSQAAPSNGLIVSGGVTFQSTLGVTGNITIGGKNVPNISTGTAAPSTTPSFIGQIFIDTTNKKIYSATGTSSSSDWTVLN